MTISLGPSNGFAEGFTSGAYDGYGHVTPRLGPEGGFFDKFYFVVDRCPPVLMGGKADTSGVFTSLTVTASEPLELLDNEQLEYVERMRGGSSGVFLRSAASVKQGGVKQVYTYNSENDDAIVYWHDMTTAAYERYLEVTIETMKVFANGAAPLA